MRLDSFLVQARRNAALALALMLCSASAWGATITIVNLDDPGEGFNDPTPAAPVGGNPGTTIGEQRLFVFQYAANIWGRNLYSPIEILVEANFDPLDCDGSSAVLGSAGPTFLEANFPNAPKENTWYHVALANRIAGEDLEPDDADISATFNSDIGKPECYPKPWYYGVDGNEGDAIELLPVVLHELGHGLGFSTSTIAGAEEVFPHIYDYFLFDRTQGMHWPDMTPPQRAASAQNCSNVLWDGPAVVANSPARLGPKPLLRVNPPSAAAGDYEVGLASFGPPLNTTGVSGDLVLVSDGTPPPNNGCQPFLNAAAVNGKVALIDRGGCPFVTKALNAVAAGAIAVVVADSVPGCPALGMSGFDPAITIPTVRITQDDGATIKAAMLLGTVNVTLIKDPALKAGGDNAGRVLVFTPAPYVLGSSVSHWDISCTPDLLMEPALNQGLSQDVDLTTSQFADIGWFGDVTAVGDGGPRAQVLEPVVPNPTSSGATISYTLALDEKVDIGVYDLNGRLVARLVDGPESKGRHSVRWDGADLAGHRAPPGVYMYRLRTPTVSQRNRLIVIR